MLMKRFNMLMILLVMMAVSINVNAASNQALKVEFGSTSITIQLSDNPKIVKEGSNIVLKTNSTYVTISFPCKVSFVKSSSTAINEVVNISNNSDEPLNVFSLNGRKVAVLKDKSQLLSLKRGIYIVNGKKIMIK